MKKKLLKSWLVLLMLVLGTGATWAETFTFTNTNEAWGTSAAEQEVTKSGITISTTQGMGSGDQYRIYKNQKFTVKSTVGKISKIIMTCTANDKSKYGPGCFTDATSGKYTFSGKIGTWIGDAETVTLTASLNQVRITRLEVVVGEETPKNDITNTKETAYTAAEAIALINDENNDFSKEVYVKGTISKVEYFNSRQGSLSYWLDENTFEVYGGLNIDGAKFTSKNDLTVGDKVVVKGILKKYHDNKANKDIYELDLNNILISREAAPSDNLTISAAEYTTYYNSQKAYTMPEGCEGYTVTVNGTKLAFNKAYAAGAVVPAGEALVIKGSAGEKQLAFAETTETPKADNALLGTDAEQALEADANSYFYALTLNADKELSSVGFYWMNEDGAAFTNGAHKAYLKIAKTAGAKPAYLVNEGEATGISDLNATAGAADGQIYNIAGQRIAQPVKGQIYIINGKKYIK